LPPNSKIGALCAVILPALRRQLPGETVKILSSGLIKLRTGLAKLFKSFGAFGS
jgi:hypothetical protein